MRDESTRLGLILVRYGKISEGQLETAIRVSGNRKAANMRHNRLGVVLVELSFCSRQDVSWAVNMQKRLRKCEIGKSEGAFDEAKMALQGMKSAFMHSL